MSGPQATAMEPTTLPDLARWILTNPWEALGRRWNHKSALLSSGSRGLLFFAMNLPAGLAAAAAAFGVEYCLRLALSGFYGALTQSFRRIEPARVGTCAAMIVLPAIGHSLEFLVHWTAGTERLASSILASVGFTTLSTAFHLFAMRRGVLVVGHEAGSLAGDLRALPGLVLAFLTAIGRHCVPRFRR